MDGFFTSGNVEAWFSGCNSKFSYGDEETRALWHFGLWHRLCKITCLIPALVALAVPTIAASSACGHRRLRFALARYLQWRRWPLPDLRPAHHEDGRIDHPHAQRPLAADPTVGRDFF